MTFDEWMEQQNDGVAACDHTTFGRLIWGAAQQEERVELIAIMKAHLTEPQVMIVTSICDRPKDIAIRECIAIVEIRSNAI